jgi:hypothetical protein
MPVRSHVETVVNRPIDVVFPFVSDFTKLPTFDPAVLTIARSDEGPDRVGTVWTQTRKAGGRVITAPIEITEYDPPHRISHVSESGPVRVEVTMVFKPEGMDTRVIEDLRGAWWRTFATSACPPSKRNRAVRHDLPLQVARRKRKEVQQRGSQLPQSMDGVLCLLMQR